jgi:hypothetical protein
LLRDHDQHTHNLVAQNSRRSFTHPIIPTLRGKIGFLLLRFFTRAPEPAAKSP